MSTSTLRSLLGTGYRAGQRLLHDSLGLHEAEDKIIADAQQYWDAVSAPGQEGGNAHWRGNGVFAHDDARWLAIGRNNLDRFRRLAGPQWPPRQPACIVDWGCGGGANAVHFAPGAARYYGIDITGTTLAECERQMRAAGLPGFVPVLLPAAAPEQVRALITEPCDLLLSTYVYELFPSKAYGQRVLRLTAELLAPGGLAFIQIKYSDLTLASQPYRWGYARNMANMTTYRIEEFWTLAEACGLSPQAVALEPEQPLVHDRRYAYFLLRKPGPA
ncbi:SAM-dependent methyltransferase [Hymenobacter sp. B81]|uniref:SAM-dependent methyltransferase n=1 Tax=Hymenobacter sp. B81 TaxID=3344878 RepID=UPI0037DD91CA